MMPLTPMMPAVDVIIVNWNAGAQLAACVDSIRNYGAPYVAQTIVVDNGSSDGSTLAVAQYADTTLLLTGENLGFGRACNRGAALARGNYLLFLNPDAALYPDTLSKALGFMEDSTHSEVGICGVQLRDASGEVSRSCSRFPSVARLVCQMAGLNRVLPAWGCAMSEWDHAATRAVNQVIGAFFLVRREVFDLLDGFDERYFVYFEEVDFSCRALQAGWSSVFLAQAQAFHAGGGSSQQVKARRLFYLMRSRLLYADKHFSRLGVLTVGIAILLLEPVTRSLLAASRCSWRGVIQTWRAYGLWVAWLFDRVLKGVTR